MPSVLQEAGARDLKETRFAPIFVDRFFAGLFTNRNVLRSPFSALITAYYRVAGLDALVGGENVELSNRLTLCRRPGNTAGLSPYIPSANIPDVPDTFYSFHEITGTVRVFADGAENGPYLATSSAWVPIFTKFPGVDQAYFQGIGQALYFTDIVDQEKWLDFGAGVPGNSYAAITATSLTSNVATIISINNFQVGQTVVISGTTNGSGAFNGTFQVTGANGSAFTFSLTHANISQASDTGNASGTWNLGIVGPNQPPTAVAIASGAAATAWQASTVFSTMGLVYDSTTQDIFQLISVNALNNNTTQFGTSGNGTPAFNTAVNSTTSDGTVTWTSLGPINFWQPNTLYAPDQPIWDPGTNCIFIMSQSGSRTSGQKTPAWNSVLALSQGGPFIVETDANDIKWQNIGKPNIPPTAVLLWSKNTAFNQYNLTSSGTRPQHQNAAICWPILPFKAANGTFCNGQACYLLAATTAGTTANTSYSPWNGTTPTTGEIFGPDGQLLWLCLGSGIWAAGTSYTQWTTQGAVFSAIKDDNGRFQVCIQSGISGVIGPDTTNTLTQVQAGTPVAGEATYLGTFPTAWTAGYPVTFTGFTNSGNNGTFTIISATTSHIVVANSSAVNEVHSGTAQFNPWGTTYGSQTRDGSVVWVCVDNGTSPLAWSADTIYNLPASGFFPPSAAQPYGGSEVIGSNFVQAVTTSGLSGSSAPSWSVTPGNTTSDNAIVWTTVAALAQNSITFTKGYGYCYAFKARTATDVYSLISLGGGGVSFGLPNTSPSGTTLYGVAPAAAPTGSADGTVSSASPTNTTSIVGASSGAVINLSGLGSTDPQVDTVSIFRTTDGGATFYWLTDIPNPSPSAGQAGTWKFQDFLPDYPTKTFNGLNTLVQAPLSPFNNPPTAGMINIVQHFGRLWGSVGSTVYASNGPLVGGASQPPGNPYTNWNPAQSFQFPSPVTKLLPTNVGLLVFTTSDLFYISGGPLIASMFPQILIPGLGLSWFNALAVQGGLTYLMTSDRQGVVLDANMGVNEIGMPIGDLLGALNPAAVYLAYLIQGSNDKALYLADGSTGWYRCNPNQAPDAQITGGVVWSPKANIVGGALAVNSVEVTPGTHALLIGATTANQPVLVRDSTYSTFTDNGTAYESYFIIGNIVLAQPGQMAEIAFLTCDFTKVGTSPRLLILLDEINSFDATISAASQSSGSTTYTYSLNTGAISPQVNMTVTITGMSHSGNNGTFVITGTGTNTFTVVNPNGVTATETGAVTNFEDLSGYTLSATGLPPQDPPQNYGAIFQPFSVYANRYYLGQSINGTTPLSTFCRHLRIKVDYGSTDTVQNEILTLTIFGAHYGEM